MSNAGGADSSSSMISLHKSMHSSQMYTPGPAMSFLTCFWLFPQKEHFSRSPPSPIRAMTADLLPLPVHPGGAPLDDGTRHPPANGRISAVRNAHDWASASVNR